MDNVNISINLLATYIQTTVPDISTPQFISGNVKSILDLCWWIIYNYSIKPIEFAGLKGGIALLSWIQDQVSLIRNVIVVDFTESFSNGLALCALIYSIEPNIIDFHNLNTLKRQDNIRLALSLSSKHFKIPPLLDITDFDDLDEVSMIIFLSFFYEIFKSK